MQMLVFAKLVPIELFESRPNLMEESGLRPIHENYFAHDKKLFHTQLSAPVIAHKKKYGSIGNHPFFVKIISRLLLTFIKNGDNFVTQRVSSNETK